MMLTIARYYSNSERMTILFCKITNQMITKCKQHMMRKGTPCCKTLHPTPYTLHPTPFALRPANLHLITQTTDAI